MLLSSRPVSGCGLAARRAPALPCLQPPHMPKRGILQRTQAYVEASVTYAVTQQAVAYALVLGGDWYLERNANLAPDLKTVGAGAGAVLVAAAILNSGVEALSSPGLILGLLASGAMFAYHVKRAIDIKDDGNSDWPGPKALPAVMALISFFALSVFIQGIKAEL